MKVMIISKDPNKQGREKNILKIVGSFDGDMDIEFYAYGTKNNEMDIDNVTFIPIWEKYTVNGLLYAQTAITEAEKQVRFNAVFPQCIELCIINIRENNK